MEKNEKAGKPCDILHIVKLDDSRESVFLIQDMFPITEEYTAQTVGCNCGCRCSECCHSNKILKRTEVLTAINWCGGRHYVEYKHEYFCPDCDSTIEEGEGTYEAHDYEQIYYADGRVQSYCTVCDESYFG